MTLEFKHHQRLSAKESGGKNPSDNRFILGTHYNDRLPKRRRNVEGMIKRSSRRSSSAVSSKVSSNKPLSRRVSSRSRTSRRTFSNRKKATTSSVNQLENMNLKSDDLAILSVYIDIISSIVGLWSLYLAKIEDDETDEQSASSDEEPPLPFGAVRNQLRRRKRAKRKRT